MIHLIFNTDARVGSGRYCKLTDGQQKFAHHLCFPRTSSPVSDIAIQLSLFTKHSSPCVRPQVVERLFSSSVRHTVTLRQIREQCPEDYTPGVKPQTSTVPAPPSG